MLCLAKVDEVNHDHADSRVTPLTEGNLETRLLTSLDASKARWAEDSPATNIVSPQMLTFISTTIGQQHN